MLVEELPITLSILLLLKLLRERSSYRRWMDTLFCRVWRGHANSFNKVGWLHSMLNM